MLEKKSIILTTFCSYVASLLLALIFFKIFREVYVWQFNPPQFSSILSLWSNNFELNFSGFIYAYIFFLPLVILLILARKRLLAWVMGIIIPFFLVAPGGTKELFWFIILTLAGGAVGWLLRKGMEMYQAKRK